jgi:YD repeat-containing protein
LFERSWVNGTDDYTYDAAGRRATRSLANGLTTR